MRSMIARALLTSAIALSMTTAAQSANLSFTLTGLFDINLGGVDFSDIELTLQGHGTTAAGLETDDGYPFIVFSSLDALVPGYGTFAVPSAIVFYFNPDAGANAGEGGFIDFTTGAKVLRLQSSAFTGYDGQSSLSASDLDFEGASGFSTPFGTARVVQASNLTLRTTGTVPEPASWAMMVGGFGLLGAGMRRRRTAVSFG